MTSNLSRPPIHDLRPRADKKDKHVTRSPRLQHRKSPKQDLDTTYSSEEEDSIEGMDVDDQLESGDENVHHGKKGRRNNRSPKAETKLYPDLKTELRDDLEASFDDNEMDIKQRGRKTNDKRSPRSQGNRHDKKTTKDKEQDKGSNMNVFLILVVLFLGVLVYFAFGNKERNTIQTEPSVDKFLLFKKEYTYLQSQFPAQSTRFWKVISAPIRRILTEEAPTYPAVLLLGVPQNQRNMGACFTKKIVHSINSIQRLSGNFYIDSRELDSTSTGKTKLDLDQRMHVALNSSRSVVLDHIEKLPAEAALILHAFCDGDNAPYKSAVIFLVLHSRSQFRETNPRQDEIMVEDMLVQLWSSELGEDEMPALQSRIANNIAILKPEERDICR